MPEHEGASSRVFVAGIDGKCVEDARQPREPCTKPSKRALAEERLLGRDGIRRCSTADCLQDWDSRKRYPAKDVAEATEECAAGCGGTAVTQGLLRSV